MSFDLLIMFVLLFEYCFFMLRLLLTMIAPSLGAKRTAVSCGTADQHFERECGLLRLRGHDRASSSLRLGVTSERVACRDGTAEVSPNRSRSPDIPIVVLDEIRIKRLDGVRRISSTDHGGGKRRVGISSAIFAQTGLRASASSVSFVRRAGRVTGSPVRFDSPECLPGRWHRGKGKAVGSRRGAPTALLLLAKLFGNVHSAKTESPCNGVTGTRFAFQHFVEPTAINMIPVRKGGLTPFAFNGSSQHAIHVVLVEYDCAATSAP
jgi:hypothetical protein